ncbi:outer membrane protein [Martelella mediterranea]|uniref:Outer membrane immunogenic protein n=1 Tax=Martelella mediterranea TaxID=293089 RepID=A0A4R3NJJ6_9HYPH|nr:outer membrane protein [Martelella mediterranea]TCT33116.1 outer membrane immunogenic protein [Martelella mediterranea]
MKKILLASAAVVAMSSSAFAADVVMQPQPSEPYIAPVATPQTFSWSGWYLGATAGYDWAHTKLQSSTQMNDADYGGFKIGGFGGYNYQLDNNVVLGVEGEFDYNTDNEKAMNLAKFGYDWEGSVRGRVGYAFDNALLYGTAGWAIANGYAEAPGVSTENQAFNGYTVGAGLDYAFTNNVFGRLEYRYTDFGSHDLGGAFDGIKAKDFTSNRVMAGVGVKF